MTNGRRYTVAGFTRQGHIKLDNGFIINRDYGHLDHGYCLTLPMPPRVKPSIMCSSRKVPLPSRPSPPNSSTSAPAGAVRASRLYTDNKEALRETVERAPMSMSASDLMQDDEHVVTDEELAHAARIKKYDPTVEGIRRSRARLAQEEEIERRYGLAARPQTHAAHPLEAHGLSAYTAPVLETSPMIEGRRKKTDAHPKIRLHNTAVSSNVCAGAPGRGQ